MIVSTTSISGSPGVTSWTLILAAALDPALPTYHVGQRCVIECDPDGGVLGSRYNIGVDPGVASLVASCRRPSAIDPLEHGRPVAESVVVVPSSESGEACESVLRAGASSLAASLRMDSHFWFADVGRSSSTSVAAPLIEASAVVVIFVRAERESILKVPSRVAYLRKHGGGIVVAVIGNAGYSNTELRQFFVCDFVVELPAVEGLPNLAAQLVDGGRSRRHQAWKAALAAIPPIVDLISTTTSTKRYQTLSEAVA